jgi:hypothetical protein
MSRRPDSDEPASNEPGHNSEIRGLPPEWGTIVVPDDLRELADDVARVRAELRTAKPASRLRRFRPKRGSLSGPLLALVLFLVAAIGSLMVVVLPKPSRPPRREPLASPTVSAGIGGGLVPAIELSGSGPKPSSLQQFRPAALLISPPGCTTCAAIRNQLVAAADATQLTVVWITESKAAVTVPAGLRAGRVVSLADPTGLTRAAIRGASKVGPTTVLVRSDGRIGEVIPDIADPSRLGPDLAVLTVR